MNLPADDHPGQGAEGADSPAAQPGGGDPDGAATCAETSEPPPVPAAKAEAEIALAEAAQRSATRRILDEVFGDVLPTVTRDELDDGSDRSNTGRDQWYRDNRPPHHG